MMFPQRLLYWRNRRGYSQEELARLVPMASQQISRYERGLSQPRLDTILRLAAALDIPPGELLPSPADGDNGEEAA